MKTAFMASLYLPESTSSSRRILSAMYTCGLEWFVEAYGCSPTKLRDLAILRTLFLALITDLDLHTVGETLWHQFPHAGGITGLALLSESHLACHTFPEYGSICFNLFSCRPHRDWDFEVQLRRYLEAERVRVRSVEREYRDLELREQARESVSEAAS
jgi:S-adenosylmethionine decarboxylase